MIGGYGVDLTEKQGYLYLPEKHWYKLLKTLFLFNTKKAHTIKEYQRLGSILERASVMMYGLTPYLRGVYNMLSRMGGSMKKSDFEQKSRTRDQTQKP